MGLKKGQLVCQHVEKINWRMLEEYQSILKELVKGRHGVYALYRKGRLYYVGLASTNLSNRLKQHLKDRHAQKWDEFSVYLTIDNSHLHDLETLILKIAAPIANKQSGNFINAENSKPMLKRKFIKEYKKKLLGLGLGKRREATESKAMKRSGGNKAAELAECNAKKPFKIYLTYKDKKYKATVRKDGTILYNRGIYKSPSAASAAIKQRASNGWVSWKYERAPGDWVLLDTLRKK